MSGRAVCFGFCLLSIAAPSLGQGIVQLQSGQQLRLAVPGLYVQGLTVRFVEARGDTLIVMNGMETQRLPLSAITKAEIEVGKRWALEGALTGGLSGVAVVGLAVLLASLLTEPCQPGDNEFSFCGETKNTGKWFAYAGGLGALLGAGAGAMVRTERWKSITLAPTVERHGGIGVKISIPASRN